MCLSTLARLGGTQATIRPLFCHLNACELSGGIPLDLWETKNTFSSLDPTKVGCAHPSCHLPRSSLTAAGTDIVPRPGRCMYTVFEPYYIFSKRGPTFFLFLQETVPRSFLPLHVHSHACALPFGSLSRQCPCPVQLAVPKARRGGQLLERRMRSFLCQPA